MIQINKTLNNYLRQLMILGILYIVIGITLSFWAFSGSETTPIFIPFTVIGALFAYYMVTFVGKGGNVNYYFTPHTPTENEKILNTLIAKYRNIPLMTIGALIAMVIVLSLEVSNLTSHAEMKIDYFVGSFVGSILAIGITCEGIKFLSAWWNIKKHWQKEFER